ncbi:phage distal tail protein [Spirillospora sp. CA-294931]|uniref:phage distal tail protein n=1 Tax=Spirillospora sp. CA-294931 TaxID=3240042 RepID=UPI003D8CD2B9
MPLLAGAQTGPGPNPPGFDWPQPLRLVYIDPDGVEWDLSDLAGPVQVTGVAGIGSPPVSLAGFTTPSGAMLAQNYRGTGRAVIVGIIAGADTQAEFLELQDRLADALWTERLGEPAPGTLRVQRPDGTARQLRVLVTAGPEQADDDRDKSGLTWTSFPITFRSIDAFWADAAPTVLTFQSATGAAGVPPMPPVALAPYAVLGNLTVTNTGKAETWPLWKITGPGTPTLTNTTLGRAFGLDVALSAGETVTINTGPDGEAYAIDQDGDDRWEDLVKSSPRDLWPLVKGTNQLNLVLAGSSAASKIELSYVRRWLRA